ncbi:hypothetical protein EBZ37_06100 [bacterium]|nr:hypothetical protein [bacterium]
MNTTATKMNSIQANHKAIQMAFSGDSTVLILGATGTGKTTLAQQIHLNGRRRSKYHV